MRELVRCDAPSIQAVAAFLSGELGEAVDLGAVWFAAGIYAGLVTGIAQASAMTLGGVVFLSREASGRLRLDRRLSETSCALDDLGPLLVHGLVHVWQFRRSGAVPFMMGYVAAYVGGRTRSRGHHDAYSASQPKPRRFASSASGSPPIRAPR